MERTTLTRAAELLGRGEGAAGIQRFGGAGLTAAFLTGTLFPAAGFSPDAGLADVLAGFDAAVFTVCAFLTGSGLAAGAEPFTALFLGAASIFRGEAAGDFAADTFLAAAEGFAAAAAACFDPIRLPVGSNAPSFAARSALDILAHPDTPSSLAISRRFFTWKSL
ncbi:MAG: hypothetical protein IJJ20_04695 [Thermoguttaceae bacterium]|nr:hypothetical protein [Thermoguttaceae bacterium]